MKKYLTLLIFILVFSNSKSQNNSKYINKNAICVSDTKEIYDLLKKYNIIMIGEQHGSYEPAVFAEELSKILLQHKVKVKLGIEAKSSEFKSFIKNPNKETLSECKFFTKKNVDGRNGEAWFDLILSSIYNDSIEIFFFDIEDYSKDHLKRDSLMAEKILEEFNKDSNTKIITLTGNLHNAKLPFYEGMVSSLNFLEKQKNIKICSIAHTFYEGSVMNNFGKGLEEKIYKGRDSKYSNSNKKCDYLVCSKKKKKEKYYDFVYYTKQITASYAIGK